MRLEPQKSQPKKKLKIVLAIPFDLSDALCPMTTQSKLTIKTAKSIVGSLSNPSKMPCHGYSIPAVYCKVGQKMRSIKGSICSVCYAMKGRYVFKSVRAAMEQRFASLQSDRWTSVLTWLINRKEKSGFFRWHDSGDIQSVGHLAKIAEIAKNLPHITFWLPTREYAMVEQYMATYEKPKNLTIRLSALMIDGPAPDAIAKRLGLPVSGVSKTSFTCPAPQQNNECKDCRACWNPEIYSISYRKH